MAILNPSWQGIDPPNIDPIKVYPCGTPVNIRIGETPGYITGIRIRGNEVSYAVSYLLGDSYEEKWFYPYELIFLGPEKEKKIGFNV